MSRMAPARDRALREDAIFKISTRRYLRLGFATAFLLVGVLGGWAALASISGAVVAPGTVVVGSNVRDVEHLTGGIVAALHVANGDTVGAGDALVTLDDTQTRAGRDIVATQLLSLRARLDRLIAERDRAPEITFRAAVTERADDPAFAELIAAQRAVFAARRATIVGQSAQLEEQLQQLRGEIGGLNAQRRANRDEMALIVDELSDLEALLADDLVPKTRVTERRRQTVRLAGEDGDLTAQIATARGRIAETRMKMLQLRTEFAEGVLGEIADLRTEIAALTERDVAATDELARVEIVAPVSGTVHELSLTTVGGVVAPGETLMRIVPAGDDLVIEARIAPQDVDDIAAGQPADVVLSGLPTRTTPRLDGVVTTVSADSTTDPATGLAHFTARVALTDAALAELGAATLVPGMPADVFIATRERTVLDYLLEPLLDATDLAFTES